MTKKRVARRVPFFNLFSEKELALLEKSMEGIECFDLSSTEFKITHESYQGEDTASTQEWKDALPIFIDLLTDELRACVARDKGVFGHWNVLNIARNMHKHEAPQARAITYRSVFQGFRNREFWQWLTQFAPTRAEYDREQKWAKEHGEDVTEDTPPTPEQLPIPVVPDEDTNLSPDSGSSSDPSPLTRLEELLVRFVSKMEINVDYGQEISRKLAEVRGELVRSQKQVIDVQEQMLIMQKDHQREISEVEDSLMALFQEEISKLREEIPKNVEI